MNDKLIFHGPLNLIVECLKVDRYKNGELYARIKLVQVNESSMTTKIFNMAITRKNMSNKNCLTITMIDIDNQLIKISSIYNKDDTKYLKSLNKGL